VRALKTTMGKEIQASSSFGEAAIHLVTEQVQKVLNHEAGTREGQDIEELHQMRVGMRRLRAALRLSEPVLKLPKAAQRKRLTPTAQDLGVVRDLDVQIETLGLHYLPRITDPDEGHRLHRLLDYLHTQRNEQRKEMLRSLDADEYTEFIQAYHHYLEAPALKGPHDQTLFHILPTWLREQLSDLWKHPGWHTDEAEILHDLRIVIKKLRYPAEFFDTCYGKAFRSFVKELKKLQEELGIIHDCDVLLGFLHPRLIPAAPTPWHQPFPLLTACIQADRAEALARFHQQRDLLNTPNTIATLDELVLWPGVDYDQPLFDNPLRLGTVNVEYRYLIGSRKRQRIEQDLDKLGFVLRDTLHQTNHYLELFSSDSYQRLCREMNENKVRYYLTVKTSQSRTDVQEEISSLVYEAFMGQTKHNGVPVVYKESRIWLGAIDRVPTKVLLEHLEGMGPYSGYYLHLEAIAPTEDLIAQAGEALGHLARELKLQSRERIQQSEVGLLLSWATGQRLGQLETSPP